MPRLRVCEGSPGDLHAAWEAFERNARDVLELAGSPFGSVVAVTADDRSQARRLAAERLELLERGDAAAAVLQLVRAAACDPWHGALADLVGRSAWATTTRSTCSPS